MEELQLLIEMVADLPQMALWVLVAFWAYKVIVIGSIYGVIRLLITKLHDWLTHPRKVQMVLGEKPIDETVAAKLNAQLSRLGGSYGYIHASDVQTLRELLDRRDAEARAAKEKK